MKGVDGSFHRLTSDQAQRLRAAGIEVWVQCLWTAAATPGPAQSNLYVALGPAKDAGLITAGYISVNGSHDGAWHVERGRAAVDQATWDALAFVAVDVELQGIPNTVIRQAIEALKAKGAKPVIYTSYHAWVDFQGNPQDFTDVPLWYAHWDGKPEIDWRLPFGGWTL